MAGEREGFSLVELIIVIAIMAILIGVIALAVIPNIGRSRESKDLTTLDNILSAANIAVANAKLTTGVGSSSGGMVLYKIGSSGKYVRQSVDTTFDTYFEQAFSGDVTLGSTNANGKPIKIKVTASSTPKIEVAVVATESTAVSDTACQECVYTAADSGSGKKKFYVSN